MISKKKVFTEIARDFFGPKSGNLPQKRSSPKFQGIFRPNSEMQAFLWLYQMIFKNKIKKKGLHPKNVTKSAVSPQKTPIWASICTPVAPSLLISSGHSPRLEGHNFRLGGTSSQLGGHGPGMPPLGAASALRILNRIAWDFTPAK